MTTMDSTPTSAEGDFQPTARTRLKRARERGHYDRETVYGILDAGLVCHVGYVIDGQPYVTATAYWREGNHVYWHGSSASKMLKQLKGGVDVCFTVSLLDGLVLARSGFHSSINYRSVMALGRAELVIPVDRPNLFTRLMEKPLGVWLEERESRTSRRGMEARSSP